MKRKGFTLIELLVVIAIIGLLSTLAVVALGSARQRARDSKRLADLKQTQTALELYYSEVGAYPIAGTAITLGVAGSTQVCLNASGWQAANCSNPYMAIVPKDPGSGTYSYTAASPGSTYTIAAALEGTVNGLSGNIRATPSGIGP